MIARAWRLVLAALVLLVGGAIAWSVRPTPEASLRLFGTREPAAVGDTATVCAVRIEAGRWALLSSTWHLRVREDGQLLAVRAFDARARCAPLLQLHGVRADTLRLVDEPWRLTPAPAPPGEAVA